jgi:hypothetical protein
MLTKPQSRGLWILKPPRHPKPANLTALCNFLFTCNGEVARAIAEILGEPDREKIVAALKKYKKHRTGGYFEELVQICLQLGDS